MWLGKRKVRGKSINHPMGGERFPEKLDEEELKNLVMRLIAGDTSVTERICEGHYRLVINIASRYAWQAPHKTDDLVSEGFRGMLHALRKAPSKLKDLEITPWIVTNVHRRIYMFLYREWMVRPGYGTYHRKRLSGKHVDRPTILQDKLSESTTNSESRYNGGGRVSNWLDNNVVDLRQNNNIRDIREVIDFIISEHHCPRVQETMRNIVHLRNEGYNDVEIAETLGLTKGYINNLRRFIKKKYIKYMKHLEG